MTNTIKLQLSTLSIEELVIEKNNAVSLITSFVADGNKELATRYLVELKLNIAATPALVTEMEEMVNARFSVVEEIVTVEVTPEVKEVAQVETSVVEVIADQLFAQGYSSEVQDDSITVYGNLYTDYDLSITVVENGFAVETYNNHSIEHFKTYEWANYKVVKTLKGLNGYLRKFGFGTVAL